MKYNLDSGTLRGLAQTLVDDHHSHLASARIAYSWMDDCCARRGRVVPYRVEKFPRRFLQFLRDGEEYEFLITIAESWWAKATEQAKSALLDFCLCHCWGAENERTGEMKWSIIGPDFEGFGGNASRFGAWNDGLCLARDLLR